MRIYQPKNELGQPLLNEGQLVVTSKSVTKDIVNGVATLTSEDVDGGSIADWDVKTVEVTLGGKSVIFTAGVEKQESATLVHFADANEANLLDFNKATINLQLAESQGLVVND